MKKGINHIVALVACLSLMIVACADDEDHTIPSMRNYSEGYLKSCLKDKGWKCVESHEVKSDGSFDKKDYWEGVYEESPDQYMFLPDTIVTFTLIEDYPLEGYTKDTYTFNEATNQLSSSSKEVFKVLTVDENTLKVIKHNGVDENGKDMYLYSIYRTMTPEELSNYKSNYIYDIEKLDKNYPLLPEMIRMMDEDFSYCIAPKGWKFVEAHKVMWSKRYDKNVLSTSPEEEAYMPMDYIISPSSIMILPHKKDTLKSYQPITIKYSYRPNSSSIVYDGGTLFYIHGLTDDTLEVVIDLPHDKQQENSQLFCLYRRMTKEEVENSLEDL